MVHGCRYGHIPSAQRRRHCRLRGMSNQNAYRWCVEVPRSVHLPPSPCSLCAPCSLPRPVFSAPFRPPRIPLSCCFTPCSSQTFPTREGQSSRSKVRLNSRVKQTGANKTLEVTVEKYDPDNILCGSRSTPGPPEGSCSRMVDHIYASKTLFTFGRRGEEGVNMPLPYRAMSRMYSFSCSPPTIVPRLVLLILGSRL